jgi:DUF4097 and DUF4098 domain-containing protein YvlB
MSLVCVRYAVLSCLLLQFTVCGCHISIDSWDQVKRSRTWNRQVSGDELTRLVVHTKSGAITVTGSDVTDVEITAEITANAPAEEEAEDMLDQVEIVCNPSGGALDVKADMPRLDNNRRISVSYTIVAPRRMSVQCNSSYGRLVLSDLEGTVAGKTSSGSIEVHNIQGSVDLDTSYGSIACSDVNGTDVTLRSSSGAIRISNISGSTQCQSSYGSVTCEGFSNGDLVLRSSSGRIEISNAAFETCEAHTSYGSVSAEHVKGDAMKLGSSSGSIKVDDGATRRMNFSTSYGRIAAQEIVTTELTAKSGSGSVDLKLSPDCPAELAVDTSSAYGSVSLTAPPDFAGQVDLSTDYGSIKTEYPVTVSGEISKRKLIGAIGSGPGRIRLHTNSGSVTLK